MSEPDPLAILNSLPVAVVCADHDADYTLRFANKQAAELLGYELEDFLHNRRYAAATVIHPDDLHLLEQADEAQSRKPQNIVVRYRLVASDGSLVPVLDVSRPALDSSGNLTGFTTVFVDLRQTPDLQGPSRILSDLT